MNRSARIFRSVRQVNGFDSSFESYYGEIIRRQSAGAPSASEARRDFAAVRASFERIAMF
jgi:hypothetical protein